MLCLPAKNWVHVGKTMPLAPSLMINRSHHHSERWYIQNSTIPNDSCGLWQCFTHMDYVLATQQIQPMIHSQAGQLRKELEDLRSQAMQAESGWLSLTSNTEGVTNEDVLMKYKIMGICCIWLHIYIYTYLYTYIYIYIHVYVYDLMQQNAVLASRKGFTNSKNRFNINIYTYTYTYTYTYIYIYIHTYTYIYTYMM